MAVSTVIRRPTWRKPRWAKVRVAVYVRDGFACCKCGWHPNEVPEDYDGRVNVPAIWYRVIRKGEPTIEFEELQIDHILAISRGGTNDLENLQTLCGACNRRKFNKDDS